MQSSSQVNLEAVEHGNGTDAPSLPSEGKTSTSMLGHSLPQDQLFSIIDLLPDWVYFFFGTSQIGYANSEERVKIYVYAINSTGQLYISFQYLCDHVL